MNPAYLQTYEPAFGLEDLLQSKVKCLASILEDIQRDIKDRTELSDSVISDLEVHASEVKSLLWQMQEPLWDHRLYPSTRKQALEKQLDSLKQEKRREQVQAWQDVQKLKEESRRWRKQYEEQRLRKKLLGGGFRGIARSARR